MLGKKGSEMNMKTPWRVDENCIYDCDENIIIWEDPTGYEDMVRIGDAGLARIAAYVNAMPELVEAAEKLLIAAKGWTPSGSLAAQAANEFRKALAQVKKEEGK